MYSNRKHIYFCYFCSFPRLKAPTPFHLFVPLTSLLFLLASFLPPVSAVTLGLGKISAVNCVCIASPGRPSVRHLTSTWYPFSPLVIIHLGISMSNWHPASAQSKQPMIPPILHPFQCITLIQSACIPQWHANTLRLFHLHAYHAHCLPVHSIQWLDDCCCCFQWQWWWVWCCSRHAIAEEVKQAERGDAFYSAWLVLAHPEGGEPCLVQDMSGSWCLLSEDVRALKRSFQHVGLGWTMCRWGGPMPETKNISIICCEKKNEMVGKKMWQDEVNTTYDICCDINGQLCISISGGNVSRTCRVCPVCTMWPSL